MWVTWFSTCAARSKSGGGRDWWCAVELCCGYPNRWRAIATIWWHDTTTHVVTAPTLTMWQHPFSAIQNPPSHLNSENSNSTPTNLDHNLSAVRKTLLQGLCRVAHYSQGPAILSGLPGERGEGAGQVATARAGQTTTCRRPGAFIDM